MQQHRTAEVVRRNRPDMPIPTEHEDIAGYCETCQITYRVGWRIFECIVQNINARDNIRHNVDMHIRHARHKDERCDSRLKDKTLFEHSYRIYSHQEDEYLAYAGIQMFMPKEAHQHRCRSVAMEIDMPIRKEAAQSIRNNAEKTLDDVIRIAGNSTPDGRSVIDQRKNLHTIETKVKVVIGDSGRSIPRERGWKRKETYYHGRSTRTGPMPATEATEIIEAPETIEAPKAEADTDSDPIQIEIMDIDWEEAQPQEASNHGTIAIKQMGDIDKKSEASKPSERSLPRRRNTIPMDAIPEAIEEAGANSDDRILLFRKPLPILREGTRPSEAGPSRRPSHTNRMQDLSTGRRKREDWQPQNILEGEYPEMS